MRGKTILDKNPSTNYVTRRRGRLLLTPLEKALWIAHRSSAKFRMNTDTEGNDPLLSTGLSVKQAIAAVWINGLPRRFKLWKLHGSAGMCRFAQHPHLIL